MQKLWSGRFKQEQNQLFDAINKSIDLDGSLFHYEIKAGIAHAKALNDINIFSHEELSLVIENLKEIENQIANQDLKPENKDEDVHMWVERLLTDRLGELGKRLHTARSRNDQVVSIVRLYLKDAYSYGLENLAHLISILSDLAEEHLETLLPAFTHLQAAQPISLAFYFMNFAYKLKRDYEKMKFFQESMNICPLGSGAVAGVNYPLKREIAAKELNFKAFTPNALDGVSDRDYIHDYLYINSLIFNHLSQLAEDLIIWNTAQFNFITLDDSFSSGSSIMPQKKNPDALELIRGKAGIAAGRLASITCLTKGIPSSYNKDLQEDKKLIFEGYKDLELALQVLPELLKTAAFNKEQMLKAMQKGYLNATDLADALVKKGMAFREAHHVVGKLVALATEKQLSLEKLELEDFQKQNPIFDTWVYQVLDYQNCIKNKQSKGSTNPSSVMEQILDMKQWLKQVDLK